MLATSLRQMLDEDPDFLVLIFELFTLARRNDEIAAEFAELLRRTREHVAEVLEAKQAEGVLHLRADAVAIADVLFSLGDGLGMRLIGDPEHDFEPTIDAAVLAVRGLLDDR